MSDHESNVHCIHCGGEAEEEGRDLARRMMAAMTADFAANPDLAAKFFITLKLAAERMAVERADV